MARRVFTVGDFVPDFYCSTQHNPKFHFDTAAGRYAVISFLGMLPVPATRRVLDHLRQKHAAFFDHERASHYTVTVNPVDEKEALPPGFLLFLDADRQVSRLFGAIPDEHATPPFPKQITYFPFTLVLDPMLRVLACIPLHNPEEHNAQLDKVLSDLPPPLQHAPSPLHPPALIVPRLLEPELCQSLISYFDKTGSQESGISNSQTGNKLDPLVKKRHDCMVQDKSLQDALNYRIVNRLFPAIERYLQYKPNWVERYVIGCYEAKVGGYFRAHRDNVSDTSKHRKFAVSILLNTGEYDGGKLCFPEFGDMQYDPPKGTGIVFSCGLLHQVMPVTKGRRFVIPTFLYDDEGRKSQIQNYKE